MSWSMMSGAIYGLSQFWWRIEGALVTEFTILDDVAGIVGSGSVGMGYAE